MTTSTGDHVEAALDRWVYQLPDPPERVRQARATGHVLVDVVDERARQEAIGREKRLLGIEWRSCADPSMGGGDGTRYLVLGEEFGEVGRAVLEAAYGSGTPIVVEEWEKRLRAELVQVAAVAVAWVEAIDARKLPF